MRIEQMAVDPPSEGGTAYPTFSLRAVLGGVVAAAVFLMPAITEQRLLSCISTFVIAAAAPASLVVGVVVGRGYTGSFCVGALIPMALMATLVVMLIEDAVTLDNIPYRVVGKLPRHPKPDVANLGEWVGRQVCYLPVGFGIAATVAGFTAVATDAMLRRRNGLQTNQSSNRRPGMC